MLSNFDWIIAPFFKISIGYALILSKLANDLFTGSVSAPTKSTFL